jgi:hypothetical protein
MEVVCRVKPEGEVLEDGSDDDCLRYGEKVEMRVCGDLGTIQVRILIFSLEQLVCLDVILLNHFQTIKRLMQVREGDWWPPPVQLDKAYLSSATQQVVFREAVQPVLEELCGSHLQEYCTAHVA